LGINLPDQWKLLYKEKQISEARIQVKNSYKSYLLIIYQK